jgi:hypothetical protein
MRSLVVRIAWVLTVCAAVSACNRNSSPAQPQPAAPAPVAAPAAPPSAPQAPPIPPGTEVPVASINSIMLNRPQDAPGSLIVDVTGTTASAGWTNPHLSEDSEAAEDPAVKTYKFVATSPQTEAPNPSPQMVDTELRVDTLPLEVKSIRVISASNEISAPVTE